MSDFIKKPSVSLSDKRREKPWTFRQFIENFSGKSYEEVKREQEEKRKQEK